MLAKQVWKTLSAIDVNKHTQKKGNLTYLSWAWAWGTLMEHYPEASYEFEEPTFFADGSCEIWCSITISDGENAITRKIFLPVMDHRNNAIANPDARQISDTRMRALVKCMAMLGLGHYIYAGEDLPANAPAYTAEQKKAFDDLLNSSGLGLHMFRNRVGDEIYTALYNSFDDKKVANKKLAEKQEAIGIEVWQALLEKLSADDHGGVRELLEDESRMVIALVESQLNGPQRAQIEAIMKEAA